MTVDVLDLELEQLTAPAVTCHRCGTPYPQHGDAGGPITVRAGAWGGNPMGVPIRCPGFQWVDPAGPSPTYGP
jgi:hypothetical protein